MQEFNCPGKCEVEWKSYPVNNNPFWMGFGRVVLTNIIPTSISQSLRYGLCLSCIISTTWMKIYSFLQTLFFFESSCLFVEHTYLQMKNIQ